MYEKLLTATVETLLMVSVSGLATFIIGTPLGILLYATQSEHLSPQPQLYKLLSFIINVGRSIPFIILMIAIIPFTKWLTGSSIGLFAAMVPLSVAAIPFFARVVELALIEVPRGLIEMGHSLGATSLQIVINIILPESLSSILRGYTLTLINLVSYSAMDGAIGGGGLGTLAYNYGYLRFDTPIMLATLVVLVVLVQCLQGMGNYVVKKCS